MPPPVIAPSGGAPLIWDTHDGADSSSEHSASCGTTVSPDYPWATGGVRDWDSSPSDTFVLKADGTHGEFVPRGVWFVEGNVKWKQDSDGCAAHPAAWSLTLLTLGDTQFEENATFKPASQRAVALVAGRDLELRTGNTEVVSCGSGAFLVHEQFKMGGNMTLDGQLVVENVGTCSDEVSGTALQMNGTAVVLANNPPPIAIGPAVVRKSWNEGAW